jgi:hypothetical protein
MPARARTAAAAQRRLPQRSHSPHTYCASGPWGPGAWSLDGATGQSTPQNGVARAFALLLPRRHWVRTCSTCSCTPERSPHVQQGEQRSSASACCACGMPTPGRRAAAQVKGVCVWVSTARPSLGLWALQFSDPPHPHTRTRYRTASFAEIGRSATTTTSTTSGRRGVLRRSLRDSRTAAEPGSLFQQWSAVSGSFDGSPAPMSSPAACAWVGWLAEIVISSPDHVRSLRYLPTYALSRTRRTSATDTHRVSRQPPHPRDFPRQIPIRALVSQMLREMRLP